VAVGYIGTRFHACARHADRPKYALPTVEDVLVEAVQRAWGDVVLKVVWCTSTERGTHAAENLAVLTVRSSQRCDAALQRELDSSDIWLLGPTGPAIPHPYFSIPRAVKRRAYRCFIPYAALLRPTDLNREEGEGPIARSQDGLQILNLPHGTTEEGVAALCREHGVAVRASDVSLSSNWRASWAIVRLLSAEARMLHPQLNKLRMPGGHVLTVLRAAEARAKLRVQHRMKAPLRALRGPETGRRSFRAFLPEADDRSSMRSLQRAFQPWFHEELCCVDEAGGRPWYETDFAVVIFAAAGFGTQQLRRMLGAVVAEVRGTEGEGYVESCFGPHAAIAPAAPAEALCLDAVTFGPQGWDWRRALGLDCEAAETRRRLTWTRAAEESRQPWAEFLELLDTGATRSHLHEELFVAASDGHVGRLCAALDARADVDARDKYGRTALHMAAAAGHLAAVETLLVRGASVNHAANGGSSPCIVAAAAGHAEVVRRLEMAGADCHKPGPGGKSAVRYLAEVKGAEADRGMSKAAVVTTLIPPAQAHAGAGTVIVDGAFDHAFLERMAVLWQCLPPAHQVKFSPTQRAHFVDSEGWVTRELEAAAAAAGLPGPLRVQAPMRFLCYTTPGGYLPPHVDLPRLDAAIGRRTTHSFLLYLTDCTEGGETLLLECRKGDEELARMGGVVHGPRGTLVAVEPRRGRLLLMPHSCPHASAATVDVPKLLVRGEVLAAKGVDEVLWS